MGPSGTGRVARGHGDRGDLGGWAAPEDPRGRGCLPPGAGGRTGECGCRGSQPFPGRPALDGTPQQRFHLEPRPCALRGRGHTTATPRPGAPMQRTLVSETAGRVRAQGRPCGEAPAWPQVEPPQAPPGMEGRAPRVCLMRTLIPLVRAPPHSLVSPSPASRQHTLGPGVHMGTWGSERLV